jgi:hypothetical protein
MAITFFAWRNGRFIKDRHKETQNLIKETAESTHKILKGIINIIR